MPTPEFPSPISAESPELDVPSAISPAERRRLDFLDSDFEQKNPMLYALKRQREEIQRSL
jgi:hypothetical protein